MSTWALWAHSFTHSLCDEVSRTLLNMRLPAHLSTGRGVRPYFRSLWWSPEIAFFPWDCRREEGTWWRGPALTLAGPAEITVRPVIYGPEPSTLPLCEGSKDSYRNRWLRRNALNCGQVHRLYPNEDGKSECVCVCGCSWNETWETLCYGWLLFTIPAIIRVIEPLWNMTERNSWIFLTQRRSLSPTSHTGGLRMGPGLRMRPSTTRWCPKWRSPCSPAPSTLQQDNTITPR